MAEGLEHSVPAPGKLKISQIRLFGAALLDFAVRLKRGLAKHEQSGELTETEEQAGNHDDLHRIP